MFSVIYYLDLLGVVIFAIIGALVAEQQQLNILGVLVSAILTAVGGGTARDILLGETPVFWIQDPAYLMIAAIAGFSVFVVSPYYKFREQVFLLADAVGLAIFTIIGIEKAISIDVPLVNAVLLGTLTAVGGGAMRDMLLGKKLSFSLQQELYVTAAFLGGWIYALLYLSAFPRLIAVLSSMLGVLLIRLATMQWGLGLPVFRIQETNRTLTKIRNKNVIK